MGWNAPRTWVVGEIETAAIFNPHVRDNLLYLKGLAGAVTIEDSLQVEKAQADSQFYISSVSPRLAIGNHATYTSRTLSTRWVMATNGGDFGLGLGDSQIFTEGVNGGTAGRLVLGANSSLTQLVLATNGNVGVGVAAPAGKLHAVGAGGGLMFVSATTVNGTLQTPVVAGTITAMAIMWGMIRNNGGATLAFIGLVSANTFQLGTALVVNCNSAADQVTITVTAGGAITVQRTNGGNSHEVDLIVVYK